MYISNEIKSIIKKYVNGFDIIYWINLDRAAKRRSEMINMLSYLPKPNIRITAIDGSHDPDGMFDRIYCQSMDNCSHSEIACCLSHLNTLKIFSESSYEIALIMEDDIYSLDFVKYWNKDIKSIIQNAPTDWEIIMLTSIIGNKETLDGDIYKHNETNIWGAGAYLVKNTGAKKIINNIYIDNIYEIEENETPIADIYIFKKLKTYNYKYAYFIYPDINNSQIHEEHLNLHAQSKQILTDIWEDYYKMKEIEDFNNTTKLINKTSSILLILLIVYIFVILINEKHL